MNQATLDAFHRLGDILHTLRQRCPWDSVQTLDSLRYLTIEETYELSEALLALHEVDATDLPSAKQANDNLKKELGDLFMHLLFYSKIAEEEDRFTTADVLNAICDKLISRHPFIYHPDQDQGENWEQLKMHEGRRSVLDGVPNSLPPLVKAIRLQEKAAGLHIECGEQRTQNVACAEILTILHSSLSPQMTEEEFGQLLFDLVQWARQKGINADTALSLANRRFAQQVADYEDA